MNCPSCALPTLAEHEFCRACGTALTADGQRQFRPRFSWFVTLLLMFGGIMIALTGKMMDLKWLTFTGVFISIGGMFLMAAFSMLRQSQSRNRKARPHPQPEPLFHANTTNKLLPIGNNDLIPSVTEATTNLLKTPANKSSVQSD